MITNPPEELIEILQSHLLERIKKDPITKCWIWQLKPDSRGAGEFRYSPAKGQPVMRDLAHRLSYVLFVEPLIRRGFVFQRCGNKLCCYPGHLYFEHYKTYEEHLHNYEVLENGCWKWLGEITNREKTPIFRMGGGTKPSELYLPTRELFKQKYPESAASSFRLKRVCETSNCVKLDHFINWDDELGRFHRKYIKDPITGCWNWIGSKDGKFYGCFWYKLPGIRNYTSDKAHRYSYKLYKGDIPEGYHIDHLCRNVQCVNPEHLEAVTPTENMRRALPFRQERSHCLHGHEYTEENTRTRIDSQGREKRECKICHREKRKREYYKSKEKYEQIMKETDGKGIAFLKRD